MEPARLYTTSRWSLSSASSTWSRRTSSPQSCCQPWLLSSSGRLAVPIQNLNPHVLMVDTAEDRYRCDAAELSAPPKIRSIFIQLEMSPDLIVIRSVSLQH